MRLDEANMMVGGMTRNAFEWTNDYGNAFRFLWMSMMQDLFSAGHFFGVNQSQRSDGQLELQLCVLYSTHTVD